jgi:hypothetical protein
VGSRAGLNEVWKGTFLTVQGLKLRPLGLPDQETVKQRSRFIAGSSAHRLLVDLTYRNYYLILPKPLHVSVVRPSSRRNIFARIYSTDNGSVRLKHVAV